MVHWLLTVLLALASCGSTGELRFSTSSDADVLNDPLTQPSTDAGVDSGGQTYSVARPAHCGSCGNGVVDCGETCDDSNRRTEICPPSKDKKGPCKVCNADCRWEMVPRQRCGDGTLDEGEQCDDGRRTRWCTVSCERTACPQTDLTEFPIDYDCDGRPDSSDNCPTTANADQLDSDADGIGDACAPEDGRYSNCHCVPAPNDTAYPGGCVFVCNASILVANTALGDTYQYSDDVDGDGSEDDFDNCPFISNIDQTDTDGDGLGDACDAEPCPSECQG